ncbi:MAG: cell division protein FtsZ [Sphingomonadales bacterium]
MTITLGMPEITELHPKIIVMGVGGAGGNAVNNMINEKLQGVDFVVANTDAQALAVSSADRRIQLGMKVTKGLGAGSRPDVGRAAAEEAIDQITEQFSGSHMVFITAGMGGGTGTGAAPVVARAARDMGVLTVGVVTKPFQFEGAMRSKIAEQGIEELQQNVDTLIIIPNQNLFRIATEKTTFADAFTMADNVLHSGVRGITDLMVMPGLINLDFADVKAVIDEMGKAMMGTGVAEGERRSLEAAETAISNPLLDDISLKGARGVLINITGGNDMTLFEVDEAVNRIRSEVDPDANIIFGSTFEDALDGKMRVSVFATGIDGGQAAVRRPVTADNADFVDEQAIAAEADAEETVATPVRPVAELMIDNTTTTPEQGPAEPVEPTAAEEQPEPHVETKPVPTLVGDQGDAPFIAPEPVLVKRCAGEQREPDPFAEAALANGGTTKLSTRRQRGPSLFERLAGKRTRREEPEDPAPVAETEPAKDNTKPTLGRVDPSDRINEQLEFEDQLEIPAFLRRQAN